MMILLECSPDQKPAGSLLVAQKRQAPYTMLVMTDSGTEYAGDFTDFKACFGYTNELGDWYNPDATNPVYTPPTVQGVKEKFNAAQDTLRESEYRRSVDRLLAESWRKEIDGRVTGQERAEAKQKAVDAVDVVKAKYPKFNL